MGTKLVIFQVFALQECISTNL